MFICKHCKKGFAVKCGLRKNKSGWIQKYYCSKCKYYFSNRDGVERYRHNAEVISAALDLRAKGLSLSDIVDHLNQHYRVKVTRKTILDWQNKFGEKLASFTQSLIPHLGTVFHADEMFVKVDGEWNFYWDCIDYLTKFLVAEHFSEVRDDNEAIDFLSKLKAGSPMLPEEIHTDNSFDYPPAFRKVFPRKRIHKHYPAWKKKFKNNPIERLHNTLKQRYKTFKGFDNSTTAKKFFTFFKVYYNFVRNHTSLGFKTPTQAAKIELKRSLKKPIFSKNRSELYFFANCF